MKTLIGLGLCLVVAIAPAAHAQSPASPARHDESNVTKPGPALVPEARPAAPRRYAVRTCPPDQPAIAPHGIPTLNVLATCR